MAKPIAPTPDFEDKDAEKLLRELLELQSEEDKKLVEEMKKQRHVKFFDFRGLRRWQDKE